MRSLVMGLSCAIALVTSATAQTLTIGVRGGPDSIDPHFTATGTHAEALKHVFDTLVWSGDGLELEPRLAESWKALNDTTWEFKLRPGVKFHDGSDFTAADVKFSIERIPTVVGSQPDHDLCPAGEGNQDHRSPHRAGNDGRSCTQSAQRLHSPVHRLLESRGGPDEGNSQRGIQLRQSRHRHRALQVRLMAAERRPRSRPQR